MNVLSKVYTAPLQRPRGSTDEEEEVRATTEATETQTQTEPGPSRRTPITPAEKSVLTFTSRDSLMRRPASQGPVMRDKRVYFYPIPPKPVNESPYANQWDKKFENSVRDKKDDQMRPLAVLSTCRVQPLENMIGLKPKKDESRSSKKGSHGRGRGVSHRI
ncbi:uncharacterized protein N7473_000179 [Penicillium subrubescens]|uniref:uncharacterized protein n=1 Tax=Penicillium subrubescens TaxID=1316194 RepID=UPI0025455526|nr:uncharacterized protein N7473_000179 [Penicillium subrubescens]KAJ5910876.1 hypothetical protein N7473_000179 [Penicillium subrubescens]